MTYDTIVVGLGAAGSTAASTLAQAGRRVLALEAQGRVGGRVNTVPFGDGVVELGAEWIHGTHPSRVYDLAIEHNIDIINQSLNFELYMSDGSLGNKELINELMEFAMEVMEDPPPVPEPLGQYISRRLKDYIQEKYPTTVAKDTEFIDSFLFFMDLVIDNLEASNSWNDVTTTSEYEDLGGHQYASWHRYGYKTFFEILLNTYKNGPGYPNLEVMLNKEVSVVTWPRDAAGLVTVSCADGTAYTADNVILTVSLGVLKERHSTLVSPSLPADKVSAIERMSMGLLGKVVLSFENAWWPHGLTFTAFMWDLNDKKKVPKEEAWTATINGPSYGMGSSNTLTLWTNGDAAKAVETMPEDVVKTKVMELLRRFMGKNITIPEPTAMIRSTWQSNPFTRGSYTYDNLLTPQYPNSRRDLGAPLLDSAGTPRVLFAGEATNPKHHSTVHGAAETGYREAMRLLTVPSKI